MRAAILTVSDRSHSGVRADLSGPALAKFLTERGFTVAATRIVPDDAKEISARLIEWADSGSIDLILTTGGTGASPRDITPEATRPVLEREIPGIPEVMRAVSMAKTPYAMLARGLAGIRGSALILNLPGSPKGAIENLEAVWVAIPHAVGKVLGDPSDCTPPRPSTP